MRKLTSVFVIAGLAIGMAASALAEQLVPYEKFTLDNGLRVIVHEDRKAPIISVGVWYHVGSKDEPRGKTGFAHLFEHIMFRGSENFSGSWFETLSDAGATGLNGTTWLDRTNYFQTVPTPALEPTLWLESDRMGHLLGAVTQEVLDAERGIVKNEKRQREGQPYGLVSSRLMAALFPEGHPYHHSTIGSMADLDAASLEDVHGWFKQYYGAANTVIVLSGDIDAATARPLMEKYFGHIAAGPPLFRITSRVPERTRDTSDVMYDKVAQTVLHRAWVVPGWRTQDKALLDLAGYMLGSGPNSRLYKALVEGHELATSVSATVQPFEAASLFDVSVNLRAEAEVADVEQVVASVLAEFIADGPDKSELSRVVNAVEASAIRAMERVGFKGQVLAQGELYAGDPGFVDQDMAWTRQASREDIRQAAETWLSEGSHQLTVLPFGRHSTTAPQADRSRLPVVANSLALDLPEMQETVLSSGIKVVLAERHEVPLVNLSLVFENAGTIAEQAAGIGTSSATFALMNDGPRGIKRSDYTEAQERLGASIGFSASRHNASARLSAIKRNLPESLELLAEAVRWPAFRDEDMERWRVATLQSIENSKSSPNSVARRVLSTAVYGPGHPYAARWDRAAAVTTLELADLGAFHGAMVRPDKAAVFVVGDTTLAEIREELEKVFGSWKAPNTPLPESPAIADVAGRERPRIILVDRPGAPQTSIRAGRLVPSTSHEKSLTLDAANYVLGGGITARLAENLRVEKGWSYGINSGAAPAVAQRLWGISTSVQTDRTAESVVEIIGEIGALTGDEPAMEDELSLFVKSQSLSLPGRFESAGAVVGSMVRNAAFGRPYDWAERRKERLDALILDDVNRLARAYFRPEALTWVLVGDLAVIEQPVRDLSIGEVEVWDTEGRRVR